MGRINFTMAKRGNAFFGSKTGREVYWMSLSLSQIAKKQGTSYSGAFRKMRNHKPVKGGYKRLYSEESVDAAFKSEEKEIVEAVNLRKWDCVCYSACLDVAAHLKLETMDCGWCKKYERERD